MKFYWLGLVVFIFITGMVVMDIAIVDNFLSKPLEQLTFLSWFEPLGSTVGIGIQAVILLLFVWIVQKDFVGLAVIVLGVAGGRMVNLAIKELTERDRPATAVEEGLSYVSGHAMIGIIMLLLMAYFLVRSFSSLKFVLFSLATVISLFVGLSRVTDGEHYATDVLGGFAIGYFIAGLMIDIHRHWKQERVNELV